MEEKKNKKKEATDAVRGGRRALRSQKRGPFPPPRQPQPLLRTTAECMRPAAIDMRGAQWLEGKRGEQLGGGRREGSGFFFLV